MEKKKSLSTKSVKWSAGCLSIGIAFGLIVEALPSFTLRKSGGLLSLCTSASCEDGCNKAALNQSQLNAPMAPE